MSNRLRNVGLLVRPRVPVAKLSAGSSGSDLTTYTFAGLDLGGAHPDRKLFAAISLRAGGTPSISSVTIGGTAMASIAAAANTSGGNRTHAAIYAAAKAADATGDLVVTMSGSGSIRCGYTLYRAVGPSLTAFDTASATGDSPSDTLDIPIRGFGIGIGYAQGASAAAWTGLTEDTDQAIEAASVHTTALLSRHDPVSALSVGISFTGASGGLGAFAMASFGY